MMVIVLVLGRVVLCGIHLEGSCRAWAAKAWYADGSAPVACAGPVPAAAWPVPRRGLISVKAGPQPMSQDATDP